MMQNKVIKFDMCKSPIASPHKLENNVTISQGESAWKLNLFEPFLNRLHCPNSPCTWKLFTNLTL